MITALDTNVLLDVFGADPKFGPASRAVVKTCLSQGRLVACEVVWAEIAGVFPSPEAARTAMAKLRVEFDPITEEMALSAGVVWKLYRRRGGKRERMLPDFLIGAHAAVAADRLLTRDRGFYRAFFDRLRVLNPA